MNALLLVVTLAAAGVPEDHRAYYDAEFQGSAAIVAGGAAATVAGVGLLFVEDPFAQGLGGAIAAVGALSASAFAYYLFLIPGRIDEGDAAFSADGAGFTKQEQERMVGVNDRFLWLRLTTGGIAVASVITAGIAYGADAPVVAGAAAGVAGGALALFVYDSTASARGHRYEDQLAAHANVQSLALNAR